MAIKLERITRLKLTIPEPFDFALTVAKPAGWDWSIPSEVFEDSALWTAATLVGRPVGLKLSSASSGHVTAAVYTRQELAGPARLDVRSALEFGLGKSNDLDGFYRFARKDDVLRRTVRDLFGMRVSRMDEIFGRVILAISLQMAQLSRSRQMMDSVLRLCGTRVWFEGREMILWPSPEKVARLAPADLREKANMGYRADRLSAAAKYLADNPLSIRELDALSDEEAVEKVMEIPGIGRYSAGIILGRSAPIDAWSVIVMSELLLGKTPENPRAEIDAVNGIIDRRWGRWSWMAFAYILNDLENLARDHPLTRLT